MTVRALQAWWQGRRTEGTSASSPTPCHGSPALHKEPAGSAPPAPTCPSWGHGGGSGLAADPPAPAMTEPNGRAAAPSSAVGVDQWSDGQMHITVREQPGQLLQVAGTARVPLSARQVFQVIVHPENERIFRHLEKCDSTVVLQDGGQQGLTVVESDHVATWRFFLLSGSIRTRLRVEQRPEEGQVHFSLLPSGSHFQLMRQFSGACSVRDADGPAAPAGEEQAQHAMLTLEQEAQPAVHLSPPLGGVFRSIACRQLRGIFEDIHAEAQKIRQGQPTLWRAEQEGA